MRELGRHKRRVREFLSLSQEELARRAGVSQGAVSRLEAGRGLATPLLVVLKIDVALRAALRTMDPSLLSAETRSLLDAGDRYAPDGEPGALDRVPIMVDQGLEGVIRRYNDLTDRQRQTLLSVVEATASAIGGSPESDTGGRRLRAARGV